MIVVGCPDTDSQEETVLSRILANAPMYKLQAEVGGNIAQASSEDEVLGSCRYPAERALDRDESETAEPISKRRRRRRKSLHQLANPFEPRRRLPRQPTLTVHFLKGGDKHVWSHGSDAKVHKYVVIPGCVVSVSEIVAIQILFWHKRRPAHVILRRYDDEVAWPVFLAVCPS